MKYSKYNLHLKRGNNYVIFNCLSGGVIEVGSDLFDTITNRDFSRIPDSIFKILADDKIIADDSQELSNILKKRKELSESLSTLRLMIHPTLHCNIKCQYCYQLPYIKDEMDEKVSDNIVEFITKFSKDHELKYLEIIWSGGEPMLSIDTIEYIMTKIRLIIPETSIQMRMISNGILLTNDNIHKLSLLDIKSIQITIDGLYNNHNTKRSINAIDSFLIIANNIENILHKFPLIALKFRTNTDKGNLSDFINVANYLNSRYHGRNYTISPGFVKDYAKMNEYNTSNILTRRDIVNFYIKIAELKLIDLNELFLPVDSFCIKKSRYSLAIGPDGGIYDCEIVVGNKNKTMINISDYSGMLQYLHNRDIRTHNAKCLQCVLLPICDYGCVNNLNENEVGEYDTNCHLFKGIENCIVKLF